MQIAFNVIGPFLVEKKSWHFNKKRLRIRTSITFSTFWRRVRNTLIDPPHMRCYWVTSPYKRTDSCWQKLEMNGAMKGWRLSMIFTALFIRFTLSKEKLCHIWRLCLRNWSETWMLRYLNIETSCTNWPKIKPRSNSHESWWWFPLSRAFEHELPCTVIDYHRLACCLDMFKHDSCW